MMIHRDRSERVLNLSAGLLAAACGLMTSVAVAAPARPFSELQPQASFDTIESGQAFRSRATRKDANGHTRGYELGSQVLIRRADGWESLQDDVQLFLSHNGITDVRFDPRARAGDRRLAIVQTASVSDAIALARLANASGMFEVAYVEQQDISAKIGRTASGKLAGPITSDVRGGAVFNDTLFADQWYIDNTDDPDKDNNLLAAYQSGLTGAGVDIALIARNDRQFESDFYQDGTVQGQTHGVANGGHPDLAANIDAARTQAPNNQLPPSASLTAMAGLLAAEGNNARDITGIAPGANLIGLISGTPAFQRTAVSRYNNLVDIQVFELGISNPQMDYAFWTDVDYTSNLADFVKVAQQNALNLGRRRNGIVQIFGTGEGFGTFPSWDRYLLGRAISLPAIGFLDIDTTQLPFIVFVPPDDGNPDLTGFPYVAPGPRINYQQLVSDRRTIVVSPVSQNDDFAYNTVFGTEVLTSVFAEVDDTEPAGMVSLTYSAGVGVDTADYINSNSASAVLGGIVALMLEANPNLTIRDIQHILVANSFPSAGMNYSPFDAYSVNTDWQVNAAEPVKPHSDRFGFGLLDGGAAIEAARDWQPLGQFFILDTDTVALEEPIEIPTATWEELSETEFLLTLDPSQPQTDLICVRQNHLVEQVIVDLSMSGEDHSDLLIELVSPSGTVSTLHLPNELSLGSSVPPYINHRFVTYKHWGEESGGNWRIFFTDFGPDEATPVGDDEGDVISYLGQYGILGQAEGRSDKTVTSYRVQFVTRDIGLEPFPGCVAGTGACPADLNADSVVNYNDLTIFLNWYNGGDLRADVNGDGFLTFADITIFVNLWQANFGFCTPSGLPYNRPSPGSGSSDIDPIVRPV